MLKRNVLLPRASLFIPTLPERFGQREPTLVGRESKSRKELPTRRMDHIKKETNQEIEWVNLAGNVAGSRMDIGLQEFRKVLEFGIMSRWPIQRSDSGACGTRTRPRDFVRNPRYTAVSAIRTGSPRRVSGVKALL